MSIPLQMLVRFRYWVAAVTQRSLLQMRKNEAKLRWIVQLDCQTQSEKSQSLGKIKSSFGYRYACKRNL